MMSFIPAAMTIHRQLKLTQGHSVGTALKSIYLRESTAKIFYPIYGRRD